MDCGTQISDWGFLLSFVWGSQPRQFHMKACRYHKNWQLEIFVHIVMGFFLVQMHKGSFYLSSVSVQSQVSAFTLLSLRSRSTLFSVLWSYFGVRVSKKAKILIMFWIKILIWRFFCFCRVTSQLSWITTNMLGYNCAKPTSWNFFLSYLFILNE